MQIGYLKDLAVIGDLIKSNPYAEQFPQKHLNIRWCMDYEILSLRTETGWIKGLWRDYELDGWNWDSTDYNLNPDSLVLKDGENIYLLDEEPEEIKYYSPPPSPRMRRIMETITGVHKMTAPTGLVYALKSSPTNHKGLPL